MECEAWSRFRNEAFNWKPLFTSIYAVLFVGGALIASFFVFSSFNGNSNSPSVLSLAFFANSDQSSNTLLSNISLTNSTARNSTTTSEWRASEEEGKGKMPPLEKFILTKELVASRVKDNAIIVTFGNYAFKDFIVTWYKHLSDLNLSNVLVGAVDYKSLEALHRKGIPVFYMSNNTSSEDLGWGSTAFHKLGRERLTLLDTLLHYGFEILFSDTDVVWLQNPLPYFARYPDADIFTSTDQLVPSVVDDSLGIWNEESADYNIGILYWRPTTNSRKFLKSWKEKLEKDEKIWDQAGFNELMRKHLGPSVPEGEGLVYAFDGHLKLGVLPLSVFCSGHTYFVQAMAEQLRLRPYAVHTTFQYSGTEGKRHRLREAMLFRDPPEYYDVPGGFLSFNPKIPRKLLLDGSRDVESHFKLLNFQLKQIRTALAIAQIIGRTLVMPPLWCVLDRFWFSHPGIVAGSLTKQPFLCPLDHVLEVDIMLQDMPVDQFGPSIDFREYSFLENPSLPNHVKDSWLNVHLCENCNASSDPSAPEILRLPKRSSEEALREAFAPHKDVKVVRFMSMQDAFKRFEKQEEEMKFRNRVRRYASRWCCMMNRDPGHIYYDFFWDEKPNWKPEPPRSWQEDRPPP